MIINADDFGYSSKINRAVVESFEKGFCSTTTIMPNMPGFEEAARLVHEHSLEKSTGIHFVFTEGRPLTVNIRRCHRFCNDRGSFALSRKQRICHLTPFEKGALAEEMRAQIKRCRKWGIPITHADSHKHAHEEWAIASIAIRICKEEGISSLRLARNCGEGRTFRNAFYRAILNLRLKKAGLARTRYFGSVYDCIYLGNRKGLNMARTSVEVMIHVGYNWNGILIDTTTGIELRKVVEKFLPNVKRDDSRLQR